MDTPMTSRKHKRHRSERREFYDDAITANSSNEKPPGLKLILKVGGNVSTPEHSNDSFGPTASSAAVSFSQGDEESGSMATLSSSGHPDKPKKAKKKKKKKEKDKDKKEKHEKKHKHKHKEKRKRSHDEAAQAVVAPAVEKEKVSGSDPVTAAEPLAKKLALDLPSVLPAPKPKVESLKPPGSPAKGSMSPRSIEAREREQRACVVRLKMEQSPFLKLLDYLLKQLEKKDPKQFFAWPVSDNFAPGYSNIITKPMDFSSIKQKIDEHIYTNFKDFADDFTLMCNNAMKYNHKDTIYHKAARKLLHYGEKILAKDKIIALRADLTYMEEVTAEQLGFEFPKLEEEEVEAENVQPMEVSATPAQSAAVIVLEELQPVVQQEVKKEVPDKPKELKKPREMPKSKFEAIPDDMTPDEILREVQLSAKMVAGKLTTRRCGDLGFLRQRKDGTSTLNILMPGSGVIPGTNERPISLGTLIGKLPTGSGQLQSFKEDRRNFVKAVKPLYYGAFGSYAPSYDSTFSNLTKEESDLVYQTYGDETSMQYAESILDFAKDCDYALTMVDNLLDLMTGGDHRRTKRVLEDRKRLREEEERIRQLMEPTTAAAGSSAPPPPSPPIHVDFRSLKSLTELGIDTSFVDRMEKEARKKIDQETADNAMQARLDNTSALISKLEMVQHERLSQEPPPHLSHIPGPSNAELNLAALVTDSLVDMSSRLPPEAVASLPAVRKALGVAAIVQEPTSAPAVPDLESELREFLESQSALAVDDDKTIEEIFSES